ncbi:MAG: hypothetical protein FWH05_06645 [Oscillospiraceae bacterium]|nr:hypothetical protein [Oscillospiraceae bacterium]
MKKIQIILITTLCFVLSSCQGSIVNNTFDTEPDIVTTREIPENETTPTETTSIPEKTTTTKMTTTPQTVVTTKQETTTKMENTIPNEYIGVYNPPSDFTYIIYEDGIVITRYVGMSTIVEYTSDY